VSLSERFETNENTASSLYLPPYSSDISPIENSFVEEKIRDVDKWLAFLEQSPRYFTPNDSNGYSGIADRDNKN
jgi:transposase